MSIAQANGACAAMLTGIVNILENDPNKFATPIGGVQSTLDPANTRGVTMEQLHNEGGHSRPVRISHKQRAIPSDITDAKSCDSGTEKPYFEEVFNVNQHAQHVIKIKESTIRNLCAAHSNWLKLKGDNDMSVMREMGEEILMDLDAMYQKINRDFLTSIALNFGTWVGGATSKTFNVLKDADHALVLTGFNQFKQELKKVNAGANPIVFGGGNLDLAIMAAQYGCCNNAGQDFGVMKNQGAGFNFYADYEDMASYLGDANAFVAYMAKTVQFVTFNQYVGDFSRNFGTMERGTIPAPALPGKSFDIRLQPSECDEVYNLWINSDYDFYFAPNNLYQSGDRLASVNGIFKGVAATI